MWLERTLKNIIGSSFTGADRLAAYISRWEGAGAPTMSADHVARTYYDTTNEVWYEAYQVGNGADDWQLTGRHVHKAISYKDHSFTSQGIGAGIYYAAGFYFAPAADANLTDVGPTVVLGAANISYAAHVFAVFADAGTGTTLTVSGTSITDAGVRTPADSEVIVADVTAVATDQYVESAKKFIGQVTYTLGGVTAGLDFNYGFAKYEDWGNRDFTVTDFEAVGLGGAADAAGFDIRLFHHSAVGWTYHATAFVPGGTVLADYQDTHDTEIAIASGEPFAFKVAGLATDVAGSSDEGVVVEITTGQNNTVQSMSLHIGCELVGQAQQAPS